MIHIVFQEADITTLQKAIELDESLQGDVMQIKDDYAVGSISNIYEAEGWQQRKSWWKEVLACTPYTDTVDMVDDRLTVHNLLKSLQEDETLQVWIWMGQNQHDVCSYYWLVGQLKDYQGRIQILYLNNLPFINEKGNIFYPSTLHEIQPKEFLKAKKLARPITLSEFEIDPDEWKKLCAENAMVRILEGGKKIVGKGVNFYDNDVLQMLTGTYQKMNKILHQSLAKMKIKTGDAFLSWRIREMVKEEKIEAQGDWSKGWKEVDIKKKSAQEVENSA